MQINPEGRTIQGLTGFLGFVTLNVMFLVTCLPIITIGPATSALYEVTIRYSDDESGHPVKDFYPAFARNFPRAGVLSLILLAPCILLAYSAIFWAAGTQLLAGAALVVTVGAAVYLLLAFLYAMALVAVYTDGVGRTLKNALLMPAAEPTRTLGVLLIPVALVSVWIIFPTFWVIIVTVGFSVGAYCSAFLFRSVFSRHTA